MTFISSCATISTDYVHSKYDFSLVQKIAVLPLENLTLDQLAGERVRKSVVSELLAAGIVDVIEPAQVNRVLGEQQIQSVSSVSVKQFQEVGKSLSVQALIVGSVDTYERINIAGGSFAEVAITLRAVDSATGAIIWSTSKSAGGPGIIGRLFGFGGDSMQEATQKAVHAAVVTLFQE
jgi:curli biogenesis system outer membrane secretion channel CsgG